VRVVADFLPAPADLVPREDTVKMVSLSRRSLDFFKREAKKRRVPYQRMSERWWIGMRGGQEGRGRV
jgi:hypothetical protein